MDQLSKSMLRGGEIPRAVIEDIRIALQGEFQSMNFAPTRRTEISNKSAAFANISQRWGGLGWTISMSNTDSQRSEVSGTLNYLVKMPSSFVAHLSLSQVPFQQSIFWHMSLVR